jgi:hypothetical protein
MGITKTVVSSVGGLLGDKIGDLIGQRIEAYRSGSEESDEGGDQDQFQGISGRISNAMPDADRLTQATTSVLDELSGGPDAEEVAEGEEADESSPSTAGQQLGEILGRRLGEMITGVLGDDSDSDEPSGS